MMLKPSQKAKWLDNYSEELCKSLDDEKLVLLAGACIHEIERRGLRNNPKGDEND